MATEKEKLHCKNKVRFGNEAAAKAAIKKINPLHKLKKPTRAYKCPVCAGYHLTSSSKK